MGHTHLNLEVELGYSHLLSTMEIASSTQTDISRCRVNIEFPYADLGTWLRNGGLQKDHLNL